MNTSNRLNSSTPSSTALLRYAVLSQVEALILSGWKAGAAVREVAARGHVDAQGRPVRVSVRTLQRWRAAWAKGGMAALEPELRTRTETSVALTPELVAFLKTEKERDPRASVPELLRRARQRDIVPDDLPLNRTTAWRACRRMGLATRPRPTKREGDMRRWRYPHRMQCVLVDGKHFRAGAARLRRVALFFLDDATRHALGVIVGPSESASLLLHGLYDVVRCHGLPDLLYLDRSGGFTSADVLSVVQGGLKAWLIHGQSRYPQGHGAIERFHRTVYEQVLRGLDGAANVDPACGALTLRLRHALHRYNLTPHETLGGEPPVQRWEQGRPLRFPEDEADLYRRFVVHDRRKVSKDHVIQVDGKLWEAPRGTGDSWIEVVRHVLDGRLWVLHEGHTILLAELDPHANAQQPRGTPGAPLASEGVPTTAADLAFDRDFLPLVDPDGGFPDQPEEEDEG
ncbi:MAG: transposase family protein [Planctomycetota bacterium]|jgi:putative transposase